MTNLCQDTMIVGIITSLSGLLNWGFGKPTEKSTEDSSGEFAQPEEEVQTLFVGDSHMKSLIAADLEQGLHQCLGGRLVHGVFPARSYSTSGGHPWRAYNSAFNWINSIYPRACQEIRVPELLAANVYHFLIIGECCNDLSNIAGLLPQLQLFLAETSALNTLRVAEEALRAFQSLKMVFILASPPRIDSGRLQALAEHRSAYLSWKVSQSPLAPRIRHCPLEEIKDVEAEVLFSRRGDGIHLHGAAAKIVYTRAVLSAIRNAHQ